LDDRCLLFFVKNPKRGMVKSRLAIAVGEEVARDLYKSFVRDMLSTLDKRRFPLSCCFYPEDVLSDITKIIGGNHQYLAQRGDDLGARMAHCFRQAFTQGSDRVVLIGSDSPDLPAEIIDEAFTSLGEADSVIGPAFDGGYYLIGFKEDSFTPEVFKSMPWGTDAVFQTTLDILKHRKRTVHHLPPWGDIDTLEDLRQFFARNEATSICPRTMAYLKDNNILSAEDGTID
jgi:rSAM/selenodomain-associated transferase 1